MIQGNTSYLYLFSFFQTMADFGCLKFITTLFAPDSDNGPIQPCVGLIIFHCEPIIVNATLNRLGHKINLIKILIIIN